MQCNAYIPERVLLHGVVAAIPETLAWKRALRVLHLLQGVGVERLGICGRDENLKGKAA